MKHLWIAAIAVMVVLLAAAVVITVAALPAVLALGVAVVALIAGLGTRLRPDRRARTATLPAGDDAPDAGSVDPPLSWTVGWDSRPPVHVLPETRERAAVVLAEWGLTGEAVETTLLVVTELLSNAMEHGGGPERLSLALADGTVRVRVCDHASERPELQVLDPLQVRGRGLHLVEALSSRWGWSDDPPGKVVWAEVPTR